MYLVWILDFVDRVYVKLDLGRLKACLKSMIGGGGVWRKFVGGTE